jgi:hypothetical protein
MSAEQEKGAHRQTLMYFQKPSIGSEVTPQHRTTPPVQVIFPGGGFGLGIPMKPDTLVRAAAHDLDRRFAVLVSGPERTQADRDSLLGLKATFIVLALFNLVITGLLFADADVADTSKVVGQTSSMPGVFEQVSSTRRPVENTNFAFTIIILLVGSLGAVAESALLVSAYCLGVVLNFLLGTYALPYFIYSSRYVLDVAMLYIGLVIRSRIMFTFLPIGP